MMADLFPTVQQQIRELAGAEGIAVALAVSYLLLAIRQNIWCWLCAGASAAIYVWLFVHARLYMESALHVFYVAMAIYGWHSWYFGRRDDAALAVTSWPMQRHVVAVVALVALSVLSGYLLDTRTNAAFPYIDSAMAFGSVWATYLVARKVLENWGYWLVIDTILIMVFWSRDLELTALLYVVYVVLIPVGFVQWRRSMPRAVPV